MKFKTKIAAAVFAVATTTILTTPAAHAEGKGYAGAGVGASGVVTAFGGVNINDEAAVEVSYSSLGSLSHKPNTQMVGLLGVQPATPNPNATETGGSAFTVAGVVHTSFINNIQPFGKVGFSSASGGDGLLVGVGVDYSLGNQWRARVEADRHQTAGFTTFTIGTAYQF